MTIASDAIRKGGPYVGNSIVTVFAFTYKIFSASDLSVTLITTATGIQQLLVLNTDYTVQINANQDTNPGGTVTTIGAISPIANTKTLTISGNVMADTQGTDIITPGPWAPDDVEKMVDRAMIAVQQLRDRALKQPAIDAVALNDLPQTENRVNTYLFFDNTGQPTGVAGVLATVAAAVTNGGVAFGSGVALIMDATKFFWDNINKRLGLGNAAPTEVLDVTGNTKASGNVTAGGSVTAGTSVQGTTLKATSTTPATDVVNGICDGRLTLTTGVPVTSADVLAAVTIFFTPYIGNRIALFDGASWQLRTFVELSIAVPNVANQMYDVFIFDNAGVLTLEVLAWTNDTTRATALVRQNGTLCKTGALTRRYLGSFRTTAVAGQTEDSGTGTPKRYLRNFYNRVPRSMVRVDTTDSWTYSTAAFRQVNAVAANQLDFINCVAEDYVEANAMNLSNTNSGVGQLMVCGIGLDSTTVNSAQIFVAGNESASLARPSLAFYKGFPGIGKHLLTWLESNPIGGATTTWFGDNGGINFQTGIVGVILG